MKNRYLFVLVALAACHRSAPADNPATGSAEATAVTAAAAPKADVAAPGQGADEAFEVSGTATAVRSTRLSMKSGGIIASIRAREGNWVVMGQPLCSLDTTDLSIRVEGAEVAAKIAETGVVNAQSDLRRAQDLYKGGAATDQAIEKAQLALTMATLQSDAAKVALKAAQQALSDAVQRAPFAGVITRVLVEEGMMVATMPPTVTFLMSDTSVLEVRVPIPERMLAQVKVGQPVIVTLPAVRVEKKAKIDRIPDVVDPATRSVEAVIRIDNQDRAVPAGLYARVRFPEVHPELATAIPEDGAKP
jgi:RND family efflux transporter MFP subunit